MAAKLWKIPRLWPEADIVIIGGGPSFAKVSKGKLKALALAEKIRVIGLNKAYKEIPDSNEWFDMIFFCDDIFYKIFSRRPKDGIYRFKGLRVTCAQRKDDPNVHFVQRDRRYGHGISSRQGHIAFNKNTGAAAINLAYHLGGPGARVFLLGYDMKRDRHGRGHWHGGYIEKNPNKDTFNVNLPFARFMGPFPKIARDAKKLGLHVYNVNQSSALEVFPKISFEQFLDMVATRNGGPDNVADDSRKK